MASGPVTGSDSDRPTVVSTAWVAGERRSTILRPDGSTLAVTVPAGGMDESHDSAGWGHDWITGAVEPCPPGLTLLHRAVLVDLSDGPSIETCRSGREAP